MDDLFEKDFIESLWYIVVSDDGVCGKAESKIPRGKKVLYWNRKGRNIDYFGNPIEFGVNFGIGDDGDSRTTFNGIVRTREQIELLLELTF